MNIDNWCSSVKNVVEFIIRNVASCTTDDVWGWMPRLFNNQQANTLSPKLDFCYSSVVFAAIFNRVFCSNCIMHTAHTHISMLHEKNGIELIQNLCQTLYVVWKAKGCEGCCVCVFASKSIPWHERIGETKHFFIVWLRGGLIPTPQPPAGINGKH